MGRCSEKATDGVRGSLGIKFGTVFKKSGSSKAGSSPGAKRKSYAHQPPSTRFYPPIGIINALLWQTGVSMLF